MWDIIKAIIEDDWITATAYILLVLALIAAGWSIVLRAQLHRIDERIERLKKRLNEKEAADYSNREDQTEALDRQLDEQERLLYPSPASASDDRPSICLT